MEDYFNLQRNNTHLFYAEESGGIMFVIYLISEKYPFTPEKYIFSRFSKSCNLSLPVFKLKEIKEQK